MSLVCLMSKSESDLWRKFDSTSLDLKQTEQQYEQQSGCVFLLHVWAEATAVLTCLEQDGIQSKSTSTDFFFDSVLVPVNVKNVNEEKGHRAYDRKVNRSQGEHFQVKIRTWILCE